MGCWTTKILDLWINWFAFYKSRKLYSILLHYSVPLSFPSSRYIEQVNKYIHDPQTSRYSKFHLPMGIQENTVISRFHLGHIPLTQSYLLKRQPLPLCSNCHTPLMVVHLLFSCPNHAHFRNVIADSVPLFEILNNNPTSLPLLITFLRELEDTSN